MDKIVVSKAMNRWTGGADEMLCYRIHIQARIRGGFWIALEKTINTAFYLIRGERDHVGLNYRWQRNEHGKRKEEETKGD